MKKIIFIVIISIFILGFFIFVESSSADDVTLFVDDDYNETTQGWNVDHFSKIQDAINATKAGNTVFVYNGTYYEHIVLDKSIVFRGEDRNYTIIDGTRSGDVIVISANNVSIYNFTVKNSNDSGVGINIYSDFSFIYGNIIVNNGWSGIKTGNACKDCSIIKNNIVNNGYGLFFNEMTINNNFSGNIIDNNRWDGIYLDHSNDGVVADNTVTNNGDDGISLIFCNNVTIYRNIIGSNIDNGVYLYSSTTIINENTVANNIVSGIFLRNSNDSCICWNAVSYSENGIELTYFSSDNNIHNNSLTENSIGIHVSSDAEGNYLSDNVFLGNNENIHQETSPTPGFEIILAIFAIMLVLLWKNHKKG